MSTKYVPRNKWFKYNGKPGYSCFKPISLKITQASVNRNGKIEKITIKQPIAPYWQILSQNIKSSTYYTTKNSLSYANRSLNSFGNWAGAPNGYGSPPKNIF